MIDTNTVVKAIIIVLACLIACADVQEKVIAQHSYNGQYTMIRTNLRTGHYDGIANFGRLQSAIAHWVQYYENPEQYKLIRDEEAYLRSAYMKPTLKENFEQIKHQTPQSSQFTLLVEQEAFLKDTISKEGIWEVFHPTASGIDSMISLQMRFTFVKAQRQSNAAYFLQNMSYALRYPSKAYLEHYMDIDYTIMGENTPVSEVMIWIKAIKAIETKWNFSFNDKVVVTNAKDVVFCMKLSYWEEGGQIKTKGQGFCFEAGGMPFSSNPQALGPIFDMEGKQLEVRESELFKPGASLPLKQ